MDTREPDLQMIAEDHYEKAMQMVEEKDFATLASFLRFTDDATAEAIRESLNAEDMDRLVEAENPAPHDSIIEEIKHPHENNN